MHAQDLRKPLKKSKVVLRDCGSYEIDDLRSIVGEGMEELGLKLQGKVFVKPNAVFGAPYAPHAYTHPILLKALVQALKHFKTGRIILGEDCGLMVPTRYVFERAGYFKLIEEEGIDYALLDEAKKTEIPIGGRVHKSLWLPNEWVTADFGVFVPKLKGHSQTTITNALKLPIGLVDRRERLSGHHYLLDEKIADLALACQPSFVVTDAVVVGQLGAGLPKPYPLGLLIMGENALAVDSVAASILGYEPRTIGHLKATFERGLGPIDLDDIEISGDLSLRAAQRRAEHFEEEPKDANQLNPHIRFFIGPVNSTTSACRGGCLGFAREAVLFINAYRKDDLLSTVVQRLINPRSFEPRSIALVVGNYPGPIPDEVGPVLLLGDCARVDGTYRRRIVRHIKGCPVFMGRSVFHLAQTVGLTNPYLDAREAYPFLKNLLRKNIECARQKLAAGG